jgi:hypothetical protein
MIPAALTAVAAISPELQAAGVVIGALAAALGIMKLLLDRQTDALMSHTTITMLEHQAECRARAAFADVPELREWSKSGRLVAAVPEEPTK